METKNLKTFFMMIFFFAVLGASFVSAQPDRSKVPDLPPPPKLNLPEIQEFELTNGLKVFLMEKDEVPLVQMNLIVKTGIVDDPEDKTGLASITLDMLDEGAASKDALELADEIDFLGAEINTRAGLHTSKISLFTPRSKFEKALDLFSDILLEPSFPQKELDRIKKERITSIMQMHDEPNAIASALFNKTLFGEENPYGKQSIGNQNTIQSFSAEDLQNFYNKNFNSGNAFVIVVGDVNKESLQQKLEAELGSWKKGKAEETELDKAPQVAERKIYLVDKPGSAQSVIRIGRLGVERKTEDYYPLLVLNTILGGSFTSRLNQNLREEHGYTYGAGSYFDFRPAPGPFFAYSSVQTEVTDSALIEFFRELNGIIKPVPEEELSRAKNYVALRFPGNFQTVEEVAGQLEELVVYDLPEDYFESYVTDILSVSGEDVSRAAEKYIDPEKSIIVIVGDREKIEDGIKKLNLGEVINYSVEDVLGALPEVN